MANESSYRHIVRVANTDLDGAKQIMYALTKIKGIGKIYANMLCNFADIDKQKKTGHLSTSEVEKLDDIIKNPDKYQVPEWMKNRRVVNTKHLIGGDLTFAQENDIRKLQKIKSYKGIRHALGLPLRGQRTKGNFRRNRGKAVGVRRRAGAKSGRV